MHNTSIFHANMHEPTRRARIRSPRLNYELLHAHTAKNRQKKKKKKEIIL